MRSPRDHAVALLEKASHDLVAAEATLATGRALDRVCFHAQQAAEKGLKGLPTSKDVVYPWRHDMGELAALAKVHFPAVQGFENALIALTPYAVQARYDDTFDPEIEEARSALQTA